MHQHSPLVLLTSYKDYGACHEVIVETPVITDLTGNSLDFFVVPELKNDATLKNEARLSSNYYANW